jgi:hypothetical protein
VLLREAEEIRLFELYKDYKGKGLPIQAGGKVNDPNFLKKYNFTPEQLKYLQKLADPHNLDALYTAYMFNLAQVDRALKHIKSDYRSKYYKDGGSLITNIANYKFG